MPRKSNTNGNSNGATAAAERIEPIEAFHDNPFSADQLDELLDIYAVPCAHEAIRRALPDRVHHHIRRLLSSDKPADRAELLALMKGAKMSIAFAVFHAVLQGSREVSETQLNSSEVQSLPAAHIEASEAV